MKLVFCGTPQFAVPTLEALAAAGHPIALVLSQPDRPQGRTAQVLPTPVKAAALRLGIPVSQPDKLKTNPELRATLEAVAPDAIIVVAYGRILPPWLLALPRLGCFNGHASLLPRWRGAAPIQWAIAGGDPVTGVTIMKLDEGLDTGPMLLRRELSITPLTTSPELFDSLATMGAELMIDALRGMEDGSIAAEPQDAALATYAPILTREDGRVRWEQSAPEIERRFRAFQPWPGAWTLLQGKKLILHRMHLTHRVEEGSQPGTLHTANGTLEVVCGNGSVLCLDEVQVEGKRRMAADEFLRGSPVRNGERLGSPSS